MKIGFDLLVSGPKKRGQNWKKKSFRKKERKKGRKVGWCRGDGQWGLLGRQKPRATSNPRYHLFFSPPVSLLSFTFLGFELSFSTSNFNV